MSKQADSTINHQLIFACNKGDLEAVIQCLNAGANPNGKPYGIRYTALLGTVINNYPCIVRALLDRGADTEITTFGHTPLLIAAKYGYLNSANYLIEYGANVNARDNYGNTPLILAAANNHRPLVRLLIANGADRQATNYDNETATQVALQEGYLEVVRLIKDSGIK